ncbi:hypothetical protein BST28156_03972 [Burkholderia stagnalis]|nr:hypothetical protein BST28156_03972 [Burkholderia stagnalis]
MMVRIVWQTARVIGRADGPLASGGGFRPRPGRAATAIAGRSPRRNQQKGFA